MATLLVCEDDEATRRLIIAILRTLPHRVRFARNGREGLAAVARLRPDLILTDMRMPLLDGLGLCRALQADPALRDIPVILMTASTGEDTQAAGSEAGAVAQLLKPFTRAELTDAIARVLPSG